ncbi:hypothetical protein B842_03230 [Corynebacterium humireducens NBRC 106098 = DSM 45392]|uniref:N-acetylmuramoyl-L-alanine amidase domain-containing protein n=2 Tax=Corynebacterium humireducens TaxID=1223514 RepID=A0A0B5D9X6_9CORY|nr:hypothetical protein B842_03230 [Corynebacterium humireducens NBRC 106098 = DSM 45392]
MRGKPVHRDEINDLHNNGVDVAAVWQFGKDRHPDVLRGKVGGELDARAADEHLRSIGMDGWPVFFAVDFDITLAQWNLVASEYFRAACRVLGRDRVGIYGHSRVCDWAREDAVIADLGGSKHLMWQTRSWSAGVIHPGAVLYQRIVDTPSTPGPVIDGVTVDVNDIRHSYWGQHPPTVAPSPTRKEVAPMSATSIQPDPTGTGDPTWLPDVLRLFGVTVIEHPGWRTRGHGDFTDIVGFMMHHTGGSTPDRTSPGYVADNPGVGGGLSATLFGHRDGTVEILGAGIAYHAGLADPGCGGAAGQGYVTRPSATGPKLYTSGNARYIGIEPQNSGREPWEPELYDACVRSAAAVLWYKGLTADRAHLPGHKEYAPSRKVDPNLNMDAFRRDVQHLIDNPPFTTETTGGLFMSLPVERQEELAAKIDRIHFELTHKFQSRYENADGERSEHRETLVGYILDNDRKIEDMHANMLPAIWDRLTDAARNAKATFERVMTTGPAPTADSAMTASEKES